MERLSQRYLIEQEDDRDYAELDAVYVEKRKCPRCSCVCSDRKASAMLMRGPGEGSGQVKRRCCCMYSRSCLIKAVIITLVVLSLLSIVGLLFWAYAANFVSLYLKAAKVDFGYVFMSDNLPDGTKSTTSLAMNAEAR